MADPSIVLVESDYGEDPVLVATWWLLLCPNVMSERRRIAFNRVLLSL